MACLEPQEIPSLESELNNFCVPGCFDPCQMSAANQEGTTPFPGAGGGGSSTVCEPCCAPATLATETLTADIFLGTAVCTGFPNVAGSHELHFTNLTFNNSSFIYQGHAHSDQCKFVQNNGSNCCVVIVSCLDEITAQVDGYYYDALGNVLHFLNQLTNPCVIDGVSLSCVACSGFDAGCCAAALSGTMFLSVN